MSSIVFRRTKKAAYMFAATAGVLAFTAVFNPSLASAADIAGRCTWEENSVSIPAPNTYGNGYVYRTVALVAVADDVNNVSDRAVVDCSLSENGDRPLLKYNLMSADRVWFGPDAVDGAYTYNGTGQWPAGVPYPPCPTPGRGVSCVPSGRDEVFQDDAAAIWYDTTERIHCNGMGASEPGCDSDDIHANGTELTNPNAYRGAGFFDIGPVPALTTGVRTTIPIEMRMRNSWSGNFATVLVLTLRYPQLPVPLPPDASCGSFTTNPVDIEAGQPFSATGSFNKSGGVLNWQMEMNIPGIYTGPTSPASGSAPSGNSTISGSVSGLSAPAGTYPVTWSLRGDLIRDCPGVIRIVDKPYVRAYGGDVFAGGSFEATGCTNAAEIKTFFNNSTSAGSASQFAAMAMGQITQFASSSLRTGSAPNRPTGLSFANTGASYPSMGGNLGGSHCIEDWFARKLDTLTSGQTINAANLNSEFANADTGIKHIYLTPGGAEKLLSLSTVQKVNNGKRIAVFVEGNVHITKNIEYEAWNNIDDIPSFYLIVKGNIYVAPNVTRLDGVYIAQPSNPSSPTDGIISTCDTNTGTYLKAASPLPNAMYTDCVGAGRLTVNGSFVAQRVVLQRLRGSIRNGNGTEFVNNPDAAEVFNYGPEVYLAKPPFEPEGGGGFDAITSLPPVF